MSRIGYLPIEIPSDVDVNIKGNQVEVKGKLGTLTQDISEDIKLNLDGDTLTLDRVSEDKHVKSIHGLYRSLIQNMIDGVTEGYTKELEIVGTGYRAAKNGNVLDLQLGFSHPLELEDPEGITVEVPEPTKIIIRGMDKQAVGQYAAQIRRYREPEPYKGKGVKYIDEQIRRKAGKAGQ